MTRHSWLVAGFLFLLIGCAAPAGEMPTGVAPALATTAAVAPGGPTAGAASSSATSTATRRAKISAVTPTAIVDLPPSPPIPTATPAAVATPPTPFPLPTAPPTAQATPSDNTPIATPSPAPPTAVPTVGYTPTNTYQAQRLLVGSGQPGRLYAWLEGFWWAEDLPGRLVVSDDLGATWQAFAGGNAQPLGMDYATGALYAQTADGLSRWNGSSWEAVSAEPITKLAVQFGEPQKMWGISQAQAARSEDGGRTWQLEPGSGQPLDVWLNPQQPGYVYLAAHVWGQHHLSRSTGNRQWDLLPKPDNPGKPEGTWRDIRGVAVDGDSGATYLMLANIISSFNPTGSQLWRSDNLNAPNVRQVAWTLIGDFGPETQMQLLAAGWNPSGPGPALYANIRPEYCPAEGGTCAPEPPWVLHRSLDGGQTWNPVAIPETAYE